MLTVLLSRNNERITDTLLGAINPIKQSYKNFIQNLQDKSHSYIFQKEFIEKLNRENRILRKRLFEQMHYLEEVKNIYQVLPELSRLPISAISIVETISYVKLNSFSQVILTKPKGLIADKLYGMIQNHVVAGIARVRSNQLYGYLTSDEKCRFSVFIGAQKAPGIAIGNGTNEMMIKFIPKWHKIQIGDKVFTSGLDNIFFAHIPVGIVTHVEIQSSYTVATIKTYCDVFHPKTFFLITNAKESLTENFDINQTNILPYDTSKTSHTYKANTTTKSSLDFNETNQSLPTISSIPSRIDQTQDGLIQPETKEENNIVEKTTQKQKKHKRKTSPLDLF
jgi:rod shape-determining protein MreC